MTPRTALERPGSSRAALPVALDVSRLAASGRAMPGRPTRELTPRMAAVLAGEAEALAAYPSRSHAAAGVALAAVAAGWSRADFKQALEDTSGIAGSPGEWMVERRDGRPRSYGDREHRVEHTWAKAIKFFAERPPATDVPSVMAEVAEIQHAADARPGMWGGQGGAGNRAVLEAMCRQAGRALRLDPTVSIRQLSEATTFSDSATARAVVRLVEIGWLRIESGPGIQLDGWEDEAGRREGYAVARQIRVRIPDHLPEALSDDELADPRTGELASVGWAAAAVHDTFTWKGLGPVAGLIYARLSSVSPAPATLVAIRVGFKPATIRKHLTRLAEHGLAVRGPHGWTRGARALDDVAVELGVGGVRQERAARHAEDRERYLAWAIEWANRHGYRVRRGLYRPVSASRLELVVERPATMLPIPRRRPARAA